MIANGSVPNTEAQAAKNNNRYVTIACKWADGLHHPWCLVRPQCSKAGGQNQQEPSMTIVVYRVPNA